MGWNFRRKATRSNQQTSISVITIVEKGFIRNGITLNVACFCFLLVCIVLSACLTQGISYTIGYRNGFDHFNENENSIKMITADPISSINNCTNTSIFDSWLMQDIIWCKNSSFIQGSLRMLLKKINSDIHICLIFSFWRLWS